MVVVIVGAIHTRAPVKAGMKSGASEGLAVSATLVLLLIKVITKLPLVKRKRTKGQTMIYTTLQKKLKIEQHEPP
jgi:hypothetical protein